MPGKLRMLVSNDDGIGAPGIVALAETLNDLAEVWVVAPAVERSTTSHAMSLRRPVFIRELSPRRFAVEGTPADCVYVGLHHLLPEAPDCVISGINAGANLGRDVFYSGTVGAAREAALHGVLGLAASLVEGNDFAMAAEVTARVAQRLIENQSGKQGPLLFNLNIPHSRPTAVRAGQLGGRTYPRCVEPRSVPVSGETYYWLGGPPVKDNLVEKSDGWLVSQGFASLTPLSLDQTLHDALDGAAQIACRVAL